ncbi:MAG TPA: hypothetical protein VJA22_03620 [Patescibacteria group bacterium]|nr:hypothetical protein [Patescibacteria group bacterium]
MILNFISLSRDRLHKVATSLTLKDKLILLCLAASLCLNVIIWIYLGKRITQVETPIPLHYNIHFGIDYVALGYQVYVIPFLGFLILLFNFTLIYVLYLKEKILSYFLALNTVLVHIFLAISSYLISGLNS